VDPQAVDEDHGDGWCDHVFLQEWGDPSAVADALYSAGRAVIAFQRCVNRWT
jgi:hypothetical protein